MELIKGSASLFYIVRNGVEIPVGCLTSNPIDENAEMMETTTRDNEGWRTSVPTMQSYSIALDGFMTMDDPNSGKNIVSYRELRKIKRNREQVIWKIKTLNGWYVDSGKAYIESISFSDPVDDMIGFSASLIGYGIPNDTNAEYDIYSDEITYNFTYSHEPENDPNSGEWFLTNLLFNNYHNAFGIVYDCDLKIKLTSVPAKGFIAHNTTAQIFTIGDEISYCDKDNLVYYPNGFNNDLGVTGNYSETFSYKIVDQDGRTGRNTTHTIIMTDTAVEPIDISVSILWNDDTSAPQTGNSAAVIVKLGSLVFDPADPIVTKEWEIYNGTDWVFYKDYTIEYVSVPTSYLENKIRLKVVSQFSVTAYSNVLTYTKLANASVIYVTDIVIDDIFRRTKFKLHVEGSDFTGFVNMKGSKGYYTKNAYINSTHGERLYIPADNADTEVFNSKIMTIPVGVYDCVINAVGTPASIYNDVNVRGGVAYGFTDVYYDCDVNATVEVELFIPATEA